MKSLIKNAKVEQLAKMFLSHGEEKDLIVKGPLSKTRFLRANRTPATFKAHNLLADYS